MLLNLQNDFIFLAGAIFLKNMVVDHWELRENTVDPFEIPEPDKVAIRDNVVDAVVHAPPLLR